MFYLKEAAGEDLLTDDARFTIKIDLYHEAPGNGGTIKVKISYSKRLCFIQDQERLSYVCLGEICPGLFVQVDRCPGKNI